MIAFGGSGALFIFYAGVAEGLMQKGLLVPGASKLSGFSGGALAAVLIAAGVPPRKMLDIYRESSIFCNGTLPDKWWQRNPLEAKAALRAYADECFKTARWPLDVVGVREVERDYFLILSVLSLAFREGETDRERGMRRKSETWWRKKREREREKRRALQNKKNSHFLSPCPVIPAGPSSAILRRGPAF